MNVDAAAMAERPVLDRLDVENCAILLDFDGTLVEIAATPQDVRVPPTLKHTLSRLRDQLSGAVALVSGRPIADLDGFFAPLQLPCVGGHGAETRLGPTSEIWRSTAPPLDPMLKRRLIDIATDTPGIIAEEKTYSVALHYRLAPQAEKSVRARIEQACADYPSGSIEVLPGKAVFEIKPSGFNKGVAVQALMKLAPFRGRRPVFLGDDVTDESVFSVLGEYGGLGFSVGRELANTQGMFATPREVRQWLYDLMQGRGWLPRAGHPRGRGLS